MSNTTVNTEDTEAQKQVFTWYHQQTLEMPSAKLDQDILTLSQTHLVDMNITRLKPVITPFWRRFPLALSSAASLVIVVGVVILNRPQVDDVVITPQELSRSAPVPQTMEPMVAAKMKAGQSEQAERRSVEAIQARSRLSAQTTAGSIEREVTAMAAVSPALPQNDSDSAPIGGNVEDKEPLAKSLQRLKVFIETRENEQALALEKMLLEKHPELAMTEEINNPKDELSHTLRAEFKMLQQQLHQAVK
ncbi:anti-sigma factor [Shewanella profunda]|uniref:anti-sigma factor n=1 Tax=Shewanella profunda TaxID=254793 RepID=UPI002010B3D9|nr:anti-sigma factor [Shewanella profunda]MCL1091240.1 anti-sigma factor [Shewanella profunda]